MRRKCLLLSLAFVLLCVLAIDTNKRINLYSRALVYAHTLQLKVREIRGAYSVNNIQHEFYFQNSLNTEEKDLNYNEDVKRVIQGKELTRLMDYPHGYIVDLPAQSTFDFTLSPNYTKVKNDVYEALITREWSPYDDVRWYFDNYPNRYILNDEYINTNNITVHRNETVNIQGRNVLIISVTRSPSVQNNKPNTYTYAYFYTKDREYYRIMFKGMKYDKNFISETEKTINSFSVIQKRGEPKYAVGWKPQLPNWDSATQKFYDDFSSSDKFKWGIFTKQSMTEGVDYRIKSLEKKIGHKFDIVLGYMYLYQPMPLYGMEKARNDGKAIELTIQIANMENSGLLGKNPCFDVYDGLKDEQIRSVARQIKAFGSPILLRLNNEMNSDWTNYSGIAALSDPDINKEIWVRIYDIFEQENVTNCIWIFNPNDKNCPPCNWNNFAAYYPGNKYVHMLGVTGYNTGSYYKERWAEDWHGFTEIFDYIDYQYKPLFSGFPWIVTEFASSSVGGDKAKWIAEMFEKMPNYKNIKAAVWWSYADFDVTPGKESIAARRYWLDETPQTTEAFKKGLKKK